jgi:hypothetical protein
VPLSRFDSRVQGHFSLRFREPVKEYAPGLGYGVCGWSRAGGGAVRICLPKFGRKTRILRALGNFTVE